MFVEMQFIKTYVGKTDEFLNIYETRGFPIQAPAQGNLLGVYKTDFGPISEVVTMWGWNSEADRRARRATFINSPEWAAFRDAAAPLVKDEERRLLIPAGSAWVKKA
jgi:hypothetical protein